MGAGKAGQFETVLENLPAVPDGMDRDHQGRIWIGMLKQRSATIDKIHQNPWVKHFLLRLPSTWMPVSKGTSVLALRQRTYQDMAVKNGAYDQFIIVNRPDTRPVNLSLR